MDDKVSAILAELHRVFIAQNMVNQEIFLERIVAAEKVVCVGAGRVGLALAGFAKRLRHLGKDAFWIHDVTLPRMDGNDLMVVGSGSGETESIVAFGRIAKREGLEVALVTSTPLSRLSEIADVVVLIPKLEPAIAGSQGGSIQPMTTLFEQSCQIYLDATVLRLMELLQTSGKQMSELHNGIE